MVKINRFFLLSLPFLCSSLYSMMETSIANPVHVVYSHACCEQSKRQHCDGQTVSQKDLNPVMTFNEQKTFKTKNGKEICMGDDSTTFIHSYGMKFAHLGQSLSVPAYPDAPNELRKAVLYTKPAVTVLAEHLYQRVVIEERKRIAIVGPCVGAGIAINCLKKLANFDQNKDYFNETSIRSKEDADAIIEAVHKGSFVAIVPLLSLKKYNPIAIPSALLGSLTVAAVTTAAYYYGAHSICSDSDVAKLGLMSAGLLGHCILGEYLNNVYAAGIVRFIVPVLSDGHYDPSHEHPIDSIEYLGERMKGGRVIFGFSERDWIMEWADEDLKRFYEAFKGENTHIVITNDKGHMEISPNFESFLKNNVKEDAAIGSQNNNTQPTLEELERRIYPWGFVSRIWQSKKWAITLVALFSVPLLYRILSQNFIRV